ncbi:PKD domain-containing protein [Pseudoflavitalea sp. X16]|uniref:PKD domain-containing protein n=1 Tax=Paraflavitalea devenefica TaxID=2716334 RepID=UPI001423F3BF|nr:PKD domain-containing protein [Paraflavitalea devenefica]NII23618.1 PKD domain-containing protein [Paraflavitalea devenefica]
MRTIRLIYRPVFFGCLLLLCSNVLQAQLKAGFSATPAAGCAPLVVKFSDESTGNPTYWRWDLGNGTISFLQNPAATYFNPGTYTIKLVIRNGVQADSVVKVNHITVYASPIVNFSASDTTGCFPLNVQFTDLSSPGDGTIVSREWDFGDGTIATDPNPEHRYTAAGKYSVSLRIRNSYGCTQTITRTQYIQLNNGVKADFGFAVPNSCKPPTAVRFTNKSTGTGTLSYEWDFGDGSTSAQPNPVHTYTATGTYSVKLVVRNNTGCADSIVQVNIINIGTVKAGFTVPALICNNEPFALINNTTPAPVAAYWTFGDGTSSTDMNPVKTYAQAGNYTIKLVSDFGSCKDSVTKNIQVTPKAKAAFTADDSTSCKAPFTANFTATSAGATRYQWLFGDGGKDTGLHVSHTFQVSGEYDVTLIVTNAAGCTDTLVKSKYVQIKVPQITITGLPQEGCLPYTWRPSFTVNTVDALVNYVWHFGDGNTATGSNPTHTYTQPGTYTVKLVYMTAGGCTDSVSVTDAIRVGNKPIVAFTATPRDVCAFQAVQFTDGSTGGKADRWRWYFGDGSTSTIQHPSHIYQDTGYFNVKLVVWSNGCQDSLTIPRYIHIKPPIARFITATVDCSIKFTRRFTDQSIGATTWAWDFGDGHTSTQRHPVHTYASPGSYIVILTVKNTTCEHTTSKQVLIVSEKADFTASDTVICKNVPVTLTAINSQTQNIASYAWTITKDNRAYGTPAGRSVQFTFPAAGQYNVRLIIKDIYGCADTLSKALYIQVNGPTADFKVLNPEVCTNTTILFADSSQSDGQHPVQQWKWNYGDGATETLTSGPFQHTYTQSGVYAVQLTVVDNLGCTDTHTIQHAVTISRPVVQFESPDTLSCTGKPVRFINKTTGNGPVYTWYFGDGQTTAATQPAHTYTQEGDYTVKLVASDRYGCADSMTRQQYIRIRDPRARFSMSDSFATCPPLRVDFTNQSLHYNLLEWDFGDGNTSTLADPSHFYTYPGTYRAKLTITSPGGCIDSLIKIIIVKGPKGTFTYDKTSGCVPTTIGFTATTNQSVGFVWDYNDGTVDETDDRIITHTYTAMGEYLPRLVLIDAQGCRVPVMGKDTIRIYGVAATFAPHKELLCDSGLVQFNNTTVSNDLITRYNWTFGDGQHSAEKNPTHHYKQSGLYTPQLVVTTQHGCLDTARTPLPLKIVQSPQAAIEGDAGACVPALLQFRGSLLRPDTAALQWQWDFGNGTTAQVQNPPAVTYATAGAFQARLLVTNTSGCTDTVFKTVNAWPLPTVSAGPDQVICRNAGATLTSSGATQYNWFPATALSCTDCATPLASPLEDITYAVTGKNIFGCTAMDSIRIQVKQPFTMTTGKGDTLCKGESFQLMVSGAEEYSWTPHVWMDNPTRSNPTVRPDTSVTYRVIGRDSQHCFADTGYVSMVIYAYPVIEAGQDQTVPVGNSVTLTPEISKDVTALKWYPSAGLSCITCTTPVAAPKQTITYTLEAVNGGGCISRDKVTLFVFCNNANVFMPNTFSPNGDGNNDVFYPRGKGVYSIRSLKIFNRWGDLVYDQMNIQANDAGKGWNGMHKGQPAPQDVYVYTMEVICENNVTLNYKGNVALIR